MDDKKFKEITNALRESARRYPFCRIANCDCKGTENEWNKGCVCMCHFYQMDEKLGKGNWKLSDHIASSKKGKPIKKKK